MSKLDLALKVLKNQQVRRVATSPQARRLLANAMKNERVRKAVVKQVSRRLFR